MVLLEFTYEVIRRSFIRESIEPTYRVVGFANNGESIFESIEMNDEEEIE